MSRYTTSDGLSSMKRLEWIRGFQSGKKWLNSLVSTETKRLYSGYFKRYCDSVKKSHTRLRLTNSVSSLLVYYSSI